MEGPSIVILTQELKSFQNLRILKASGNSSLDKKRFVGKKLIKAKSWGKHLLLDFGEFWIKVHFLMFGSYTLNKRKPGRKPRLRLTFEGGNEINFYTCSVTELTDSPKNLYDWRVDPLSRQWNPTFVRKLILEQQDSMVCDMLMDQQIFSGVGNIIKNEVLHQLGVMPTEKVKNLPKGKITALLRLTAAYCRQFIIWKKAFVLRKNWKVFRRKFCADCGAKVTKRPTGQLKRLSHFCSKNCRGW